MRIAGIDPSITATGIVVMEPRGFGNHEVTHYDVIKTKPEQGLRRLSMIREAVTDALSGEPGICGVECNYVHGGRSVKTALECREAVGVCIEAAGALGWHVVRVAPTQAKKALGLAGGSSTKSEMVIPASRLFPEVFDVLRFIYAREAVADAIGNALVAAQPQHRQEIPA